MTKAELIKAIEGLPDHTPVYVVDESSGSASFFDVEVVLDMGGEIAEIHLNH